MEPRVILLGITRPITDSVVEPLGDDWIEMAVPVNDGLWEPLDIVEYAGRADYGPKSLEKLGDRSIIGRWIKSGHESMLEMVDVVFEVTCSRVVSHELVRHRMASYQQESQRYVKYEDEEPDDLVFYPPELSPSERLIVEKAYEDSFRAYQKLRTLGVKAQIARYVLPNGTRTRIVVKMNLRGWRHFLLLRMHPSAQPEMQIVANAIHDILVNEFPEVFGDIKPTIEAGERAAR